ncbi:hypothetical protein Dsin_010478 [Dipteronia sinensis]|uniref:Uncharacterized protein n=1 Tax=Dipteronia sinensis TaxID=43782 RepID=A0AAE0ASL4_9ROSI|nr:hypothetical protein Dsin_010478 [Dipteronia sinensis]
MIENYCYGDDGYSMQQESYQAMQNEYNNNNNNSHHSSVQMMKPSSEYSKQNMMTHTESYGHSGHGGYGGHGGHGGHQNSFGGHNMYQSGYSGSLGSASNGYNNNHHMSHTSMGPIPASHQSYQSSMNAASHLGGGGGYNNAMMMSSTGYDNYNNKVYPGPMRVQQQTAPMGYGNGKWGSGSGGYYYNQSGVNCMPSNGHHSSEWISKSLDN